MKLDSHSHIDQNAFPSLSKWDVAYRKNHEFYQDLIDSITYHLQKTKRGVITSNLYPYFYQKDHMHLQLYKLKQQLGNIDQEEVNVYSNTKNPHISKSLSQTFSSKFDFPKLGLFFGVGGVGLGTFFNFHYGYRAIFFVTPMFAQYAFKLYKRSSFNIESIEFMQWALEYRAAKAKLEMSKDAIPKYLKEKYNLYVKSDLPSFQLYDQILDIVCIGKH